MTLWKKEIGLILKLLILKLNIHHLVIFIILLGTVKDSDVHYYQLSCINALKCIISVCINHKLRC